VTTELDLVKTIVEKLRDKKVEDLRVLDISKQASFTDYMIIGTGTSSTHVRTLADAVVEHMKKPGEHNLQPEADIDNSWILYDGGHFIVNIFQPDARIRYSLEDLWQDAEQVEI
jgi:ribosome-associated protein